MCFTHKLRQSVTDVCTVFRQRQVIKKKALSPRAHMVFNKKYHLRQLRPYQCLESQRNTVKRMQQRHILGKKHANRF